MSVRRTVGNPSFGFAALSGALAIVLIAQTSNRLWSNLDFWLWLAAARELSERPLDPSHPLLATSDADPYLGPYSWLVGLVIRLTAADPVQVLAVVGVLNAGLIVGGIWVLTRRFSVAPWAPVLMVAFSLVAWGWGPWRWSGYINLNSLGFGLPYGSMFAVGVGLLTLAWFWSWLDSGAVHHLWKAALGGALVVLTHQMTGLWVTLICAGFLLAKLPRLDRRGWLLAGAPVAVAALVALAWPFYSLSRLLQGVGEFDELNAGVYRRVALRSFLAWPGVVLLVARFRRDRRDPLAVAALLVGSVFVVGWVLDRESLGRVLPGLILLAHLAMADWFATNLGGLAGRRRRSLALATSMILLVGLAGTATGWLRSVPRSLVSDSVASRLDLESAIEPWLEFGDIFVEGDVVAAAGSVSLAVSGASAAKVLAVDVPQPFVGDIVQRRRDLDELVDPLTPRDRRVALLAEYDPGWFVVDSSVAPAISRSLPGSQLAGEVGGYTVIRLSS